MGDVELSDLAGRPVGTIRFGARDYGAGPRAVEYHVCVDGIVTGGPLDSRWSILSLEPLTITPSIHCVAAKGGCGLHGWIVDGEWVPIA